MPPAKCEFSAQFFSAAAKNSLHTYANPLYIYTSAAASMRAALSLCWKYSNESGDRRQ
jgi:hypothetical protein